MKNTGENSTGSFSTGHYSTGECSTGNFSTGGHSTGNRSTGDYSTGYNSTGHHSTGHRSTGYRSTGHWSISKYSSGHFSTKDYSGFGCFDKACTIEEWEDAYRPDFLYFNLTEWINQIHMTDQEKKDNPNYKTMGGYLKAYNYKEAFKRSWDNADKEDRMKIIELPNFDADKFKEISGIDVYEDDVEEMTMEEVCKALGRNIKIKK